MNSKINTPLEESLFHLAILLNLRLDSDDFNTDVYNLKQIAYRNNLPIEANSDSNKEELYNNVKEQLVRKIYNVLLSTWSSAAGQQELTFEYKFDGEERPVLYPNKSLFFHLEQQGFNFIINKINDELNPHIDYSYWLPIKIPQS